MTPPPHRLRLWPLLAPIAFSILCGCMANDAYYLETAGDYHSWDELRIAAEACGFSARTTRSEFTLWGWSSDKKDVEYKANRAHWDWEYPNSEEFSIQNNLLVPLTLTIIPARFEAVATWEVHAKDWSETVKIRTIGHESGFPTGAFPATFGADRRCVSCPDNLEAYFTEAAFAVDIARALHVVKQHAAKETPTSNAPLAP